MSDAKMEATKFTPGPWRADGPDPFGDWNILHSGDSLAVAAVVENLRQPNVVAANAHLIAAAPDLCAALEKIVFDWDGEPEDIAEARAALSRAQGRTNG